MTTNKKTKSAKSKEKKPSIWSEPVFQCSLVITILVLFFFALALNYPIVVDNKEISNKWAYLLHGPPNEIGDTLAGLAGALAFIWLIATVLLQAKELREQRQEFEKMADAQEEQVMLLMKQGEIFEQEQLERSQLRAKKVLEEKLKGLRSRIERASPLLKTSAKTDSIFHSVSSIFDYQNGRTHQKRFSELEIDEYFEERFNLLDRACHQLVENFRSQSEEYEKMPRVVMDQLREEISAILQLKTQLGADQGYRIERLGLASLDRMLHTLLSTSVWK